MAATTYRKGISTLVILSLLAAMLAFAGTARADSDRMSATLTTFEGIDGLYDLKKTSDGGYISTGNKPDEPLNRKGLLVKLNAKGEKAWSKNVGGEYLKSVIQTSDGGYAYAGRTDDSFFFGKATPNGEVEWENTAFGSPYTFGSANGIVEIPGSGFIVAGSARSAETGMDQMVLRTDLFGNEVWSKHFGESGDQCAYGLIKAFEADRYILIGNSNGSGYLLNMDGSGNKKWEGEYPIDSGTSLLMNGAQSSDGTYVMTGNIIMTKDSKPNTILLKADAQGNMKWEQIYHQANPSQGSGVIMTRDGGYAITGTAADYKKMILLKTDAAGNLQWIHTEDGYLGGRTVLQLADGSYLVAGAEQGSRLWNIHVGPPLGLTVDDQLNVINGLDNTMEYSTDNGKSYQTYDPSAAPSFDGNVSVLVRYKADLAAGYETGEPEKFDFTVPTIQEVEALYPIQVPLNTPLKDLGLPETVKVTLSDGSQKQALVIWDQGIPTYNATMPFPYIFNGQLIPPAGATNPLGKNVTVMVLIQPAILTIQSVEQPGLFQVPIGTPLEKLGLPKTVRVTLSDNSIEQAEVSWDEGIPLYNGNMMMFYTFTGQLTPPAGVANSQMLKVYAQVMVVPSAPVLTITEVKPFSDIRVTVGTELSNLGLPENAEVTLSDNSKMQTKITWNQGEPTYDKDQPGTYPFTGELTLPEGVTNPNKAEANIHVIVDSAPLTVAEVKALPDISVPIGTESSQLQLPEKVKVTLSDRTEVEAGVTWNEGTPAYDKDQPGTYPFTGELTLSDGVTNPSGYRAELNVIVSTDASPSLTGITLDSSTYRLEVGKTHSTVVTAVYSDGSTKPAADPLAFNSSKPVIASVDENGIVKGLAAGTAVITAQYQGFTAEATVTVWQESQEPQPPQEPNPPSGGESSPSSPSPVSVPTPPANPDHVVTGCSSTQPCTVKLGDGVQITLPGGTASASFTITIDKITLPSGSMPDDMKLISSVYELKKSFEDKFQQPVTLRFAFNSSEIGKGQHAALFYLDETIGKWVEVESKIEDDRVVAEVDHFTKFAVFAVADSKEEQPVHVYQDIKGHWAEGLIQEASGKGLVTGYEGDLFRPDQTITRAEFTVMLTRALGIETQAENGQISFTDGGNIPLWAKSAVSVAVKQKLVSGYEDGTFRPDGQITRAEMSAMIVRALNIPPDNEASLSFADEKNIPNWVKGFVAAAAKQGIVHGLNGEFAPDRQATRAEAAVMLLRMLQAAEK
ncbi:DUF4073 domain-containing protein [Paenibacillus dokdonensis]|uniref:DUF4073 domain-containing protein n=1 Tax=Paenibacillus dokdonensis TaxID=2567944 RepID=A0ABU6GZY3_9BACL|nr:DUF4073 domain-containing protein [Paenibacillus dokdonensis]MEC0244076.1 DUF4073 domain-containing protein [Paenibacillus dokdonensis]